MRIGVVFSGGKCLEESVTYQAIVEKGVAKGELQGARRMLIQFGHSAFLP
jgi:hypothetical protein